MGALEAKNTFEKNLDVLEVRLTGVDVALASRADGAESPRRARLARDPVAATATVSRRVDSRACSDDDANRRRPSNGDSGVDTVVRARVAPARLELSSADFKRIAGCVAANAKERPARIPPPRNPAGRRARPATYGDVSPRAAGEVKPGIGSGGPSRPRRASSAARAREVSEVVDGRGSYP